MKPNLHTVNLGLGDDSIVSKRGYVINKLGIVEWGSDNLLPVSLLSLAGSNPQVKSILETQAGQVAGEGLFFEGPEAAKAQEWADWVGIDEELIARLAFDATLFGAVSLRVSITQKQAEGIPPDVRKSQGIYRYGRVSHQRVAEVRVVAPLQGSEITEYFTAPDWAAINPQGKVKHPKSKFPHYTPQKHVAWSPLSNAPNQMMYSFRYHPAMYFYPLPDIESISIHAEAQRRIVDFHNNSLANGIASNLIINFPFQSTGNDEEDAREQAAITESIRARLAGNNNAGNPIIVFYSADAEAVPTIEPVRIDDNGQKYIETNRNLERLVNVGLGVVSPELYGMTSSAGFSSQADLLMAANDIQYSNKIKPLQGLITRAINKLLQAEEIDARAVMSNSLPVVMRITTEMVDAGIFTEDEFREAYGYPPKPNAAQPEAPSAPEPDAPPAQQQSWFTKQLSNLNL